MFQGIRCSYDVFQADLYFDAAFEQSLWSGYSLFHYAEDVVKGVSLPYVLSAKHGRKRQFVVPRYARIKLAIRLAVTTAALSKGRSPCRAMVAFMIRRRGGSWLPFHDSWCLQDMGN